MIENTILSNLLYNEKYIRKVIPYIKEEYFTESQDKLIFSIIDTFFRKFNKLPTKEILEIELNQFSVNQELHDNVLKKITDFAPSTSDLDWLFETTEKFCQDKAIYNSLRESIEILDNKSKKDKGAIVDILKDALAVSFDQNVGHDYLDDMEERYNFYTTKEDKIKFDIDLLNKITGGGVSRKTLNVFLAHTGGGKSMFMCHAAANNLLDGKNVLYITLEMSEKKIAERIDANLLDVPINLLKDLPFELFKKKIEKVKSKKVGKLVIKEYPTSAANSNHFRFLLNELKTKKNFVPDIIYIDYLNICASARIKAGAANSYTYVKAIAEEIRGLAVEFNVPIVTATQVTRGGYGSSDIDLTDTSESFGLPATADLMVGIIVTEELEELGQVLFKQLKNRYGDINYYKKFTVGIDRSKMRFYNLETANDNDEPVFDKTETGERVKDDRTRKLNF